jgi:peroxiredoxin
MRAFLLDNKATFNTIRRYFMLRIDNPAPQFTLMSTKGEISLEGFKGKYVVLFFYPLDFTPV